VARPIYERKWKNRLTLEQSIPAFEAASNDLTRKLFPCFDDRSLRILCDLPRAFILSHGESPESVRLELERIFDSGLFAEFTKDEFLDGFPAVRRDWQRV